MFTLPVEKFRELTPIPADYYTENRQNVINRLKTITGDKFKPNSFILLRGHEFHHTRHDDDAGSDPENEPNFMYLFGLPFTFDLHGLLNVDSGEAVLVVKDLTELELIFDGGITKDDCPKKLNVSRIITEKELKEELKAQCTGELFLLNGKIRNDKTKMAQFDWLSEFSNKNTSDLYNALCTQRAIKTKTEVAIMREIISITCEGHKYVMQQVRDGMGEHHLSEMFKLHCGLNGTSKLAYATIVGSGRNGSILHYIVNNKVCKDGELLLMDVGVMGNGYCADVTTTFPINGKFDEKQKQIYNAVLRAQVESMNMVKPGIKFRECQTRSFEIIAEDLLALGIFKDATPKELVQKRIVGLVLPHSLGHYLGMYTHDVGCCIHSDEDNCSVSTSVMGDVLLEPGMVITVEPGIYFIRSIIEDFKKNPDKAKYVNFELLEQYFYIGGVRIEDDVVVTETGFENLSPLPRTVEEIEAFMKRD